MSVQAIPSAADPGPRRWTASIATLIGEGYIGGSIYDFDGFSRDRTGSPFRATPITETAAGLFTAIEVAK